MCIAPNLSRSQLNVLWVRSYINTKHLSLMWPVSIWKCIHASIHNYNISYTISIYGVALLVHGNHSNLPGDTRMIATAMRAKTIRITRTAIMIPFQLRFSGLAPTNSCKSKVENIGINVSNINVILLGCYI